MTRCLIRDCDLFRKAMLMEIMLDWMLDGHHSLFRVDWNRNLERFYNFLIVIEGGGKLELNQYYEILRFEESTSWPSMECAYCWSLWCPRLL